MEKPSQNPRRRHSPEFKARLVAACQQPGVAIAAIAMANAINPNQLGRWIREHQKGAAWTARGHHRANSRYSDEFKQEVIRQCLAPDASVTDIAREHGINYRQIYGWIRVLAQTKPAVLSKSAPAPAAKLLPVVMDEEELPATKPAPEPTPADTQIEIEIGGAHIRLRGEGQLEALRVILESLR